MRYGVRSMVTIVAVAGLLSACTDSQSLGPIERGRRIYRANCVVCHNPDPTKPGSAGPEVAGASRALIEARVLHASYPPGYTPKRSTKAMLPLPFLAQQLDDLAAFLGAAADGGH